MATAEQSRLHVKFLREFWADEAFQSALNELAERLSVALTRLRKSGDGGFTPREQSTWHSLLRPADHATTALADLMWERRFLGKGPPKRLAASERYRLMLVRQAQRYTAQVKDFCFTWGLAAEWAHEYVHISLFNELPPGGFVWNPITEEGLQAPTLILPKALHMYPSWDAFQEDALAAARLKWDDYQASRNLSEIGRNAERDLHWLFLKAAIDCGRKRSWSALAKQLNENETTVRVAVHNMADRLGIDRASLDARPAKTKSGGFAGAIMTGDTIAGAIT